MKTGTAILQFVNPPLQDGRIWTYGQAWAGKNDSRAFHRNFFVSHKASSGYFLHDKKADLAHRHTTHVSRKQHFPHAVSSGF